MALETNFQIVESPESDAIWVFDTTGFYHVTNNPTGWGGVNPTIADVTTCSIVVTLPDPATLQVSTDPALQFTLTGSPLPNLIGNKRIILNTSLGLDADIDLIDGNYQFDITVSGTFNAVAFTQTFTTVQCFLGQLQCCAQKATVSADMSDVNCAPCREKFYKIMLINLAVDGVIANNACGKPNKALEILKTATGLCDDCGCSGCN
jgi:hypothetical protein